MASREAAFQESLAQRARNSSLRGWPETQHRDGSNLQIRKATQLAEVPAYPPGG